MRPRALETVARADHTGRPADFGDEQLAPLRPLQGCRGYRAVLRGAKLVVASGQLFPS
jgi:hypothetical protein